MFRFGRGNRWKHDSVEPASRLRSASLRYRADVRARPAVRFFLHTWRIPVAIPPASANDTRLGRLEAALFLAREPLSLRKLASLARLADATEARSFVAKLSQRYDSRGSAFVVARVAGGYQLMTRASFAPWLRKISPAAQEMRLSTPALETLAVVAYRQPVGRAEIEAIRGVQCGELLRQLMDRDLLRIAGRSEELGRPLLYGTTRRFLLNYGLSSLDGLPRAKELRKEHAAEK